MRRSETDIYKLYRLQWYLTATSVIFCKGIYKVKIALKWKDSSLLQVMYNKMYNNDHYSCGDTKWEGSKYYIVQNCIGGTQLSYLYILLYILFTFNIRQRAIRDATWHGIVRLMTYDRLTNISISCRWGFRYRVDERIKHVLFARNRSSFEKLAFQFSWKEWISQKLSVFYWY